MVKIRLLSGLFTGEHSSLLLPNSLDTTMEKSGWLHISYLIKNEVFRSPLPVNKAIL